MQASSIHLIYRSLLAAIFAGILHFQYCHKAVIDRYNQLASAEIQIIREQNKLTIAAENEFVEEYDYDYNIFYLKKLWALDSILDIACHSLQYIHVDSIDGFEAIYKQHLKAVFQDEKYLSIPASMDTFYFTHTEISALKNVDYRATMKMEYYFKTAEIERQVMMKISRDCGFTVWYPLLIPPTGPPPVPNGYTFNIMFRESQYKTADYIFNRSTRAMVEGVIKIDTIFPKPGWYPFYAEVTTGGRFRTPAITQYDTIYVHVFPK